MKLEALTLEAAEQLRHWRNKDISIYRTPFFLTEENQEEWYKQVTRRDSRNRYYSIMKHQSVAGYADTDEIVGVGGLTGIQRENRIAEISLTIDPEERKHGMGRESVALLLKEAFNTLNLNTVYGEVYMCGAVEFWKKCNPHYTTMLPKRKYVFGQYFDSMYFSWSRDGNNG